MYELVSELGIMIKYSDSKIVCMGSFAWKNLHPREIYPVLSIAYIQISLFLLFLLSVTFCVIKIPEKNAY